MTVWSSKPHAALLLSLTASIGFSAGCNPPKHVGVPGTLGQPVSVKGDLQVLLHQPDKSKSDVYAAIFSALETTTVQFCANDSSAATATCDGKKVYTSSFQKRSETGFYFISSEPLVFSEGTRLLFLAYISNNGNNPSQRGQAVFYEGKVKDADTEDADAEDTDSNNITNSNGGSSGIDASLLIGLFKQLLGSGGSTTTPTPTPITPTPTPITPTPGPTPVTPGTTTGQTDALVPNPENVPLSPSEFEVIRLTNAERQRQGKQPLIVQQKIMITSRESSRLMKQQNRMVHGLTSGWNGENIANGYSSPQQVVQGWINSPGHYRNMMGGFRYIGVGDTKEQGGSVFWTQQFNN